MIRIFFCLSLILVFASLYSCSKNEIPPPKLTTGQRVPDLDVVDLKGRKLHLATQSGKTLVVNVWATWCAPCRYEMPSLDKLAQMLGTQEYAVLGLSIDNDDHVVREFLIERSISFSNYLDIDMDESKEKLGIRALPSTLIISPEGNLIKLVEGARDWDTPEMVAQILKP